MTVFGRLLSALFTPGRSSSTRRVFMLIINCVKFGGAIVLFSETTSHKIRWSNRISKGAYGVVKGGTCYNIIVFSRVLSGWSLGCSFTFFIFCHGGSCRLCVRLLSYEWEGGVDFLAVSLYVSFCMEFFVSIFVSPFDFCRVGFQCAILASSSAKGVRMSHGLCYPSEYATSKSNGRKYSVSNTNW